MASTKVAAASRQTKSSFRRAADRIRAAAQKSAAGVGPALRRIGEEIMTDVKASGPGRGVPIDLGDLARSGEVWGPHGPPTKPSVALTFGGPSAPYALIQHENLDYHHDVGEARYLVRGMERWRPGGSAAWKAFRDNAQAGLAAVAKRGA